MGTEHLLVYMQEGQVGVFLNQDFCSLYTTDVPVLHFKNRGAHTSFVVIENLQNSIARAG